MASHNPRRVLPRPRVRTSTALAKRKLLLSRNLSEAAAQRSPSVSTQSTAERVVESGDGKTVIHVHCNGGNGGGGRGCGNWGGGCLNTCPVYDSLGYPYYPLYGPPSVSWLTNSPLVPWGVPLPPPACPPCGVNISYQGPPAAWQFPQVAPPFMSNLLPRPPGPW